MIEVDLRSHVPVYVQIVERIGRMIASGALHPGDQLPTVRQLATDLRVNFNTVARAYRLLDEAGVISTQQGRGTYVQEALPADQAGRLRQATLDSLARTFLADAGRMGFSPEEVERAFAEQLSAWRSAGQALGREE